MTLHVLNSILKYNTILKPCILQMESLIMKVLFYLHVDCRTQLFVPCTLTTNKHIYIYLQCAIQLSQHSWTDHNLIHQEIEERDQEVKPKATEGANVRGGI